ncbi:hypothetical protein VR7878_02649 [Vibrio ruber DSM 16370]|uniref:SGNH hydrolase-type esterase domain-containing protein n=1 Tax=Vibrio ruber (strain DSM 16370 / JCM 11486 / BCRC 17186 / CECT 7878 / LMG 23124 / VR1) TaxID=1123498 RepID=A0A1R4LNP8_VIBR1|nr:hypothetical protein [Vibrio ruber]SJN58088.1 hypothetical protein VR7878_02649 [Vibrio ruber DSM 16370]
MKKIKFLIVLFFLISLLGLLVDAGSDLLLYARKYHLSVSKKNDFINGLPKHLDYQLYSKYYDDNHTLKYRYLPYVGDVIQPGDYGIYKINQLGGREYDYDSSSVKTKKLLVLGASQAFGFYNSSDKTLVTYLSALLPEYEIDNYSSPGQMVSQNLANWQRIHEMTGEYYDLAIIVNGPFDYVTEYNKFITRKNNEIKNQIAFFYLMDLVEKKIDSIMSDSTASIDEYYNKLIPNKIMGDFEDIINYGASLNTRTLIFIPPVVWGNKANVDNIGKNITKNAFLNSAARNLSDLSIKNSNVIDMSNVFDDMDEQFFIDFSAHLTPNGNHLLAKKIVKYIKQIDNENN